MTGVALKLQVRDEYYDSVESGHAKEEHYQVRCFCKTIFYIYFHNGKKVFIFTKISVPVATHRDYY